MDMLSKYMDIRAGVYRLLAHPWYLEITNEWLTRFQSYIEVFNAVAAENPYIMHLRTGCDLLQELPEEINEAEYASRFVQIFLNVDLHTKYKSVTPHESVYRSTSGMTRQDEWEQVYKLLIDEGLGRNKDHFKEPEDHISSELYFMAALAEQTGELLTAGNMEQAEIKMQTQSHFLSQHLSLWVDALLEHLLMTTDDKLYRAIAYLTVGFVQAEVIGIDCMTEILTGN